MILIQGIVYRLTKFSIYNFVYAELLREDGVNISIRKANNITINKYTGVISFKYTNIQK